MRDQFRTRIRGHGTCAGADRKVKVWDANQIDHQRDGQDRTAAAKHAQCEAGKTTGQKA